MWSYSRIESHWKTRMRLHNVMERNTGTKTSRRGKWDMHVLASQGFLNFYLRTLFILTVHENTRIKGNPHPQKVPDLWDVTRLFSLNNTITQGPTSDYTRPWGPEWIWASPCVHKWCRHTSFPPLVHEQCLPSSFSLSPRFASLLLSPAIPNDEVSKAPHWSASLSSCWQPHFLLTSL